jgi:tRNA A37 methylthiotransferase MiaB
MKYFIKTYGCQMNMHDSEKIAGIFSEYSIQPSESVKNADVIILNTCNIRQKAEQKFYSELALCRLCFRTGKHRQSGEMDKPCTIRYRAEP